MQDMNDMIRTLFGLQAPPQFDMNYHLMNEVVPQNLCGMFESTMKINIYREALISFSEKEGV
jgi:hypothetical protein